ncbi:hypothetical protein CAEBREN_25645 [Caenorhabditis brenneri]|uniref:F-box domain-containing protein n=1 Tax=Caenorhabditis brenneri TaxID=135651 RepID=G0MX31_CAEBE|nr:hypothetical protein CAEBREN_25645 [Caenorhabditis brenneri]
MDPPLSLESLKITETNEKTHVQEPKLRNPVKSFFDLNTDSILHVLHRMPMHELFSFLTAYPQMENLIKGKVKLDKCEMKLMRIVSSVKVGKFEWSFNSWANWDRSAKKESNRTVGPLSLDVYQENESTWQSEVKDTMSTALSFVNWIIEKFPKTEFERLDFLPSLPFSPKSILKMPIMKKFKEEKIAAPFLGEQDLEDFFNESIKRHQIVVLEREGTYKLARAMTIENDPLGMLPSKWFHIPFLHPDHIEVILLKDVNMKEENLHFEVEEWDVEEMEEYEENALLQIYWQERGRIIRNRNDEPASVHFNLETGTFVFVVWHTETMFSLLHSVRHF